MDRSIDKVNLLFLAPEAKESDFGDFTVTSKADIWSLGAILYLIINRKFKFLQDESPLHHRKCSTPRLNTGSSESVPLASMSDFKIDFDKNNSLWENFSFELKDFISECLEVDPNNRKSADQLL